MVWHIWGKGKPLVLLHGGSGSWTHWLRNVQALASTGRRVLVPDLPGFGDSAEPEGTDADASVEPVAKGITQLLGVAACDVVGFSYGGLVGGLLAAQHPARVQHLVLVGAPGLGLRDKRLPLTPWRDLPDGNARNAVHRSNLAALMFHQPDSIDELAVALQAANTARDRMRARKLALTDILARTLLDVGCPVDAIYGREDALFCSELDELAELLESFPGFGELVLIPGAGHWVQFEDVGTFNRQLLRLLDA